jgi:spore coat polysaccharide biosynthesis protein SpsF
VKIVATIEARMTSSRLPGKVLLEAGGRPMLHHLVRRLRAAPSIHEIVLATTVNATDDVLIEFAKKEGIRAYRGSELDVMGRVVGAGEMAEADVLVEITGDCPIIDPDLVEQTIRMFLAHQVHRVAYVANNHIKAYPDGMDTQVFRLETLQKSAAMTSHPLDREHVSLHIRNHPELFPHVYLIAPPSLHAPELGLTLDEPTDYELIRRIIEHFGDSKPLFGCLDVLRLLEANPDWIEINRNVKRKRDT